MLAPLPVLFTARKFLNCDINGEMPLLRIDADDVAVPEKADRTTELRFGSDMADAEAARGAGEAPVGDEGDLVAHALSIDRRRGRQHFAHAGTAARPLIADDQHIAFLVLALCHRLETSLFRIEATRRAGELQLFHAGHFDDGAFGRE